MTIKEAAQEWVRGFNAIDTEMISRLMQAEIDNWGEVTLPSVFGRVYVEQCSLCEGEHWHNDDANEGEIVDVCYESETCIIRLDDGTKVEARFDDIEVMYDGLLPMWGTMWSFGDAIDNSWLEDYGGIEEMSKAGFRVYLSDEFGYFFGIDGAGYDFYESHWIPLYKARGLKWHDTDE